MLQSPSLPAQVTFAGTQLVAVSQSLVSPSAVATDAKNVLYIADTGNNRILRVAPSGIGYAAPAVILQGLLSPQGIAVDWYGNVYVADTGNGRLVMLPASSAGFSPALTLCSGLNSPVGVAVDPGGNVYLADSGNNRVLELPNLAASGAGINAGSYGAPVTLVSGLRNPTAIAVDSSRTLYVADTGNNRVLKLLDQAGGYPAQITITKPGMIAPTGVAVDRSGNVLVTDSGNHRVLEFPWVALVGYYYPAFEIGGSFSQGAGVAADMLGNVYVADAGKNRVEVLRKSSVNFGTLAVGSSASPQMYDFNIAAGTTIGSVAIYTQGVSGKDFVDAGDSSCAAQIYTIATICGVDVVFNPLGAGTRAGAVVVYDPNGHALATAYISGAGSQPQAAFIPGSVTYLTGQMSAPSGVAVDGSGNLYVADTGNDRVLQLPWNGVSYGPQTALVIPGLSSPMGLAIDGAGNLYIASNGNDKVVKLAWNGSSFAPPVRVGTGLYGPSAVAVDITGNLYIADTFDNAVWKEPWSGSAYQAEYSFASYSKLPLGVAVDGSSNAYFTLPYLDGLGEVPWNGASYGEQESVPLSGLQFPTQIAVDGTGNLYVVDANLNEVVMIPWTGAGWGSQITVASGFNTPTAVAVDGLGDVFVTDSGNNQVVKIALGSPAQLSFAATILGSTSVDSAKVVTVQNIGNEPLAISTLTYPPDFPEANVTTDPCTGASTVPQGTACQIALDFTPLTVGTPLAEAVSLTDNSSNGANQTVIPLTGVASGKAQQQIIFPPITDLVYGAPAPALHGTASSGLPVTYQVLNGPASLVHAGTALAINGAGTVVVVATQSGNASFNAAPSLTVTFHVLPAILTVTPVNTVATYGSIPTSLNYTVAGYVLNQNQWSAFTGKPLVTSSCLQTAPVGTCVLTASQGSMTAANYTFAFATATLTVNPAPLYIGAHSPTTVYGRVLPALGWAANGFLNGDTPAILKGTPQVWTTANSSSPVGTYPVNVSAGTLQAANYFIQPVPGVLHIIPAVLTFVARNQTSVYGAALPALTWSVFGLMQQDTMGTAVQGTPAISTTAMQSSPVGVYPITVAAGTLTAANYTFQFQAGLLSIQKATMTVVANNLQAKAGAPIPALTYTVTGLVKVDSIVSATMGAPLLGTAAKANSKAGKYAISISAGSMKASNYVLTFQNGTLTITP